MTDNGLAALAAALEAAGVASDMFNAESDAAAILAALPPGWRTPIHDDPEDEARCDGHCARNECICSPEAYADEEVRRKEIAATIAALRAENTALREGWAADCRLHERATAKEAGNG
jgi:hypothetical protein